MMSFTKILASLIAIFVVSLIGYGCTTGSEQAISPALQPYFDSFREEAAERGIIVDYELEGITGTLSSLPSNGVIGQCQFIDNNTRSISIDRFFWSSFTDFEKELVIYHELGHCFLSRGHLDQINNDGTCVSIMASSIDICDSNYTDDTREEYIDELFEL